MSDQPQQPEVTNAADPHLPKHQKMTVGQHLFVWTMVVVVGVLFGMGSNVNMLGHSSATISGIDQNEIFARQRIARKLQDALNPNQMPAYYGGEMFVQQHQEGYAENILLARQAEAEGLKPAGATLDGIVSDFLAKKLGERTYGDALADLGGDRKVTEVELRRFLAEREAVDLLRATHVITPAVPLATVDAIAALRDQVEIDEVVIDAKPVLPEIKPDDTEVQSTYDRLRGERFRRPAARIVTIATTDLAKLSDAVTITDADLASYYDAHKDEFAKPVEKDKDGKELPKTFKALTEVAGDIRTRLRRERAEAKSKELVEGFDKSLADQGVETLELAAFKAAAQKAGLTVNDNVTIDEPEKGADLAVTGVGQLDENQLHLFAQDVNFVSTAVQAKDGGAWAVIHLDAKRDAGYRELSDPAVSREVIAVVAGKRAYAGFIKAMETLRADAEKLGPGGLRKAVAAEAALKWDVATKVTTVTKPVLDELRAPAADFGGIPGEARVLASLLVAARPVALDAEEAVAGVPRVRLVQAVKLKAGEAVPEANRARMAEGYRKGLERYRETLYQADLANRISRQ
jgi:hypothetical protein